MAKAAASSQGKVMTHPGTRLCVRNPKAAKMQTMVAEAFVKSPIRMGTPTKTATTRHTTGETSERVRVFES
jgi:hypothetical protein